MNYRLVVIVLLFTLSFNTSSYAFYKQYTTSNSLISNTVYHAFRDGKGFMWFSTDKGICKYDGRKFKNFTVLNGLADNDVFNFYEDKYDRIWVYTYNGAPCYLRNDSVFTANNDPFLRNIPVIPFLISMLCTSDTTLYLGYLNGTLMEVNGSQQKTIYGPKEGKISEVYMSHDSIRALTWQGIITINKHKVVSSKIFNFSTGWRTDNKLFVISDDSMVLYKNDSLVFKGYNKEIITTNVISAFVSEDCIFCSTRTGLLIINYVTGKKIILFPNFIITSVVSDIHGNYWITTIGNGVCCLSKEFANIRYIKDVRNDKMSYIHYGQLFGVADDSIYTFRAGNIEKLPITFKNKFQPLYINNNYFFYTNGAEMYIYDRLRKKIIVDSEFVKHIYPYSQDQLLLLAARRYDNNPKVNPCINKITLSSKNIISHDNVKLGNERIFESAYNVNSQQLYVLSHSVLSKYNPLKQQYKEIASFSQQVLNLFCVNNKVIVVTGNRTIIVYDEERDYVNTEFSTGDMAIYEMYSMGPDSYLVRTDNGYYLLQFYPGNFIPAFKKIEYPFNGSDIHFMYPYGDSILCNVNDNLCTFPKYLLYKKTEKPILFINKVTVNDKDYNPAKLITLHQLKANISIVAGSLYFSNTNSYYQYRIIRNDETSKWYKSENDNINALLSGFGRYRIEIRTITENNSESIPKSFDILLLPPFYYSVWFITIEVLIGIVILTSLIYMYVRRRRRKFQNELHYMQLEHKAINSLLNPHFIFNAINNIQNLVNKDEREQANNYLAMLSKLIRQNIENLKFDLISLDKELILITNYIRLQNLRFNGAITLTIHDHIPQSQLINIPPLLIHTFIENAIVHGYRKAISNFNIVIDLSVSTEGYLIITITDNGVGLARAKIINNVDDKTSMGIDFTRKRLERLSSFYNVSHSLRITDLADKGSRGTEVLIIIYARFKELITVP